MTVIVLREVVGGVENQQIRKAVREKGYTFEEILVDDSVRYALDISRARKMQELI